MAEPDRPGISARLWRLPSQLLLALINATAMLVIVAAILALVALARIEYFAGNIVATMTDAVLSKLDLPSKDVLANIRELTGEVRALGKALREIRAGENPVLQSEIARLKEPLIALTMSVDRLASSRSILTDEVAARFGDTITQTLMKLRDCYFQRWPKWRLTALKAEALRERRMKLCWIWERWLSCETSFQPCRHGHHSTTRWSSNFLLSGLILPGAHAAAVSLVHRKLGAVNP